MRHWMLAVGLVGLVAVGGCEEERAMTPVLPAGPPTGNLHFTLHTHPLEQVSTSGIVARAYFGTRVEEVDLSSGEGTLEDLQYGQWQLRFVVPDSVCLTTWPRRTLVWPDSTTVIDIGVRRSCVVI